jgi:hypothetical protein
MRHAARRASPRVMRVIEGVAIEITALAQEKIAASLVSPLPL